MYWGHGEFCQFNGSSTNILGRNEKLPEGLAKKTKQMRHLSLDGQIIPVQCTNTLWNLPMENILVFIFPKPKHGHPKSPGIPRGSSLSQKSHRDGDTDMDTALYAAEGMHLALLRAHSLLHRRTCCNPLPCTVDWGHPPLLLSPAHHSNACL